MKVAAGPGLWVRRDQQRRIAGEPKISKSREPQGLRQSCCNPLKCFGIALGVKGIDEFLECILQSFHCAQTNSRDGTGDRLALEATHLSGFVKAAQMNPDSERTSHSPTIKSIMRQRNIRGVTAAHFSSPL
jgi:hypothetical protein